MRERLSRRLVRRTLQSVALVLLALNLVAGWWSHRMLHDQSDRMLLELAALEARLVGAELDQPLHVHSALVHVPGLQLQSTSRYGLVLDEACGVRALSPELSAPDFGAAWLCEPGAPDTFFLSLGDLELRAARARVVRGGAPLSVVVGVDHRLIDHAIAALIASMIALSLLVLAVLFLILRATADAVTRDLTRIQHVAEASSLTRARFDVDEAATEELAALAGALNSLSGRAHAAQLTQERFIAEAAHELRTPVAALRGEIEVTLRRPRDAQELREALENMQQDTLRLESLVRHLLDAARARAERYELAPVPLREVAERALATLSRIEPDAARVVVEVSPDATALADPEALGRVLTNLCLNAVLHARASRVVVEVTREGGLLHLDVHDDGRGVPEALAPSLFTAFERGGERKGHGLGLYIARNLMRAQGGDLTLVPSERGARFRLTFAARP